MPSYRMQKQAQARKDQRKTKLRVIAISYDGVRTEDSYFRGWMRYLGNSGVQIAPFYVNSGGNALQTVKACKKKVQEDGPFDEVWCVCDVDDTSNADLVEARRLAVASGIDLCTSNRSFEIWLALHFGEISLAPITNEKAAIKLVSKYFPKYSERCKEIPFSTLLLLSEAACSNADRLNRQGFSNPSTEVAGIVKN